MSNRGASNAEKRRVQQLVQQADLAARVKMLSQRATVQILERQTPDLIVLVNAATTRLVIPAFQISKSGHPIAKIQQINRARGVTSVPSNDGWANLSWWIDYDLIFDHSVRPLPQPVKPTSLIGDNAKLDELLDGCRVGPTNRPTADQITPLSVATGTTEGGRGGLQSSSVRLLRQALCLSCFHS